MNLDRRGPSRISRRSAFIVATGRGGGMSGSRVERDEPRPNLLERRMADDQRRRATAAAAR